MSTETPVRLYFKSGATHDMPYTTDYPIVGLDPEGRVIVDMTSEFGLERGLPYLFGLTLCCDAFDKGMEDGVYCRACYGEKSLDAGSYFPTVTDEFSHSRPWLPVPGHIRTANPPGNFCTREGTLALDGNCQDGCDHAAHYSNDGHAECEDLTGLPR